MFPFLLLPQPLRPFPFFAPNHHDPLSYATTSLFCQIFFFVPLGLWIFNKEWLIMPPRSPIQQKSHKSTISLLNLESLCLLLQDPFFHFYLFILFVVVVVVVFILDQLLLLCSFGFVFLPSSFLLLPSKSCLGDRENKKYFF